MIAIPSYHFIIAEYLMNLFWKITSLTLSLFLFSCSSSSPKSPEQQVKNSGEKVKMKTAKNNYSSRQNNTLTSQPLFSQQVDGVDVEKTLINKNINQHNRNSRSLEHVQFYQTSSSQHLRNQQKLVSTKNRSVFARNTQYTAEPERPTYSNSLSDRELMLSFYRAPKTVDEKVIANIIAEEQQFVKNNYTGFESMYVRFTPTRGSTEADPASVNYKLATQKQHARFGMVIAGR